MPATLSPTRSGLLTPSQARSLFPAVPGYLDAATCGVPPLTAADALRVAVDQWAAGVPDLPSYDLAVTAARDAFARLVTVPSSWVAIGAQVAGLVGTVAASLPDNARVLVVDGDFTSVTFPFLAQADRGVQVRAVPLESLAEQITPEVDWVAFSQVQSADGRLAALDDVLAAARASGTRTLVDLTQSAGWLPVDAGQIDVTVTGTYKWLSTPRGVAFATVNPDTLAELRPINASWYAGPEVWSSVYASSLQLADDARRLDVSPAWLTWIGAVPALELFATLDLAAVQVHNVGLADRVRYAEGLASTGSAIVSLPDPDGDRLTRLRTAGFRAAGRAGRLRLAFHLWNDEHDVDRALAALHG